MDRSTESGRWGRKRLLGIGIRLLVTLSSLLMVLALYRWFRVTPVRERPAVLAPTAAAAPTARGANARLRVEVRPDGAKVLVDGLQSGRTPVSLELLPGRHEVRVELDGYAPQVQTVDLIAGAEAVIRGELALRPLAAIPSLTAAPTRILQSQTALPDLQVQYAQIELETNGACSDPQDSTQLGVRMVAKNAGDAAAGPFVVEVNGARQEVQGGLKPEEDTSLWFPGYNQGGENRAMVDAASQIVELDEGNNTFVGMLPIPTLPPTCTPLVSNAAASLPTPLPDSTKTPGPRPSPSVAVTVRETQITIPTYPYAGFVTQAWNSAFGTPFGLLDWSAYEASSPAPIDRSYRLLVVENEYLRLTFLPELGGRIYEVTFKPTGHRETYRNPVLKPSHWGPPEQGWWLAAGGIEWCLPVAEHGYEWGVPWTAKVNRDAAGVTVTLRNTEENDRLQAEIAVRLESGAGYFTIRPHLVNPTGASLAAKYWTNAMLAPGGRNAPSADLRFVLPGAVTAVTVHSRGDDWLPGDGERLPWPLFGGVDLSRLGNWNRWLGFFEDPSTGGFLAVYDEDYDEGMVRVSSDAEGSRGAKVFGFGWRDAIPPSNWTDDGSRYVEIHGGPAPTYEDSVTLAPGGSLQWTETWVPVAGLGGLSYANGTAALYVTASGGQAQMAAAMTRPGSGDLVLLLNGLELWRQRVALEPGKVFRDTVSLGDEASQGGSVVLRLEAPDGAVLAEAGAELANR